MPLPSTMTPIATTTLSSAQASVTFSSISGSYTDLVLVSSATISSSATDIYLQFNNDTGSNYSVTILTGDGTAASSTRYANQTWLELDYYGSVTTTAGHVCLAHIMNYSNSTTYKTVLSRAGRASSGLDAIVGLWRSTSAITSIKALATGALTFASGSTFTLYGIKAAS